MEATNMRVKVWDLPLRLFHWALVISIAIAFLSAEEDSPINNLHVMSGWVAALLIVFRLVWGVVGGEHSRFTDFVRPSHVASHVSGLLRRRAEASLGHNPLGGIAVLVLLALTAVTIWTGAFGGENAAEMHEIVGWVLLAMVALHIAAVVAMSILERENLVRAMITGDKATSRHPGAMDANPSSLRGLLLAGLAVGATAYAILQYDAEAFTPRSAESFEHRNDAGHGTSLEEEEGEGEL